MTAEALNTFLHARPQLGPDVELRLVGDLTRVPSGELARALAEALWLTPENLILDLADCTHADLRVAVMLERTRLSQARNGGTLVLRDGTEPVVRALAERLQVELVVMERRQKDVLRQVCG